MTPPPSRRGRLRVHRRRRPSRLAHWALVCALLLAAPLPAAAQFNGDFGIRKDVLEIGVGMGADHLQGAQAGPRSLTGIDLTSKAVGLTRARLALSGASSRLLVSDAENLPFPAESFDLVDSWGVLHHSPRTDHAIAEVRRVLAAVRAP